MPSLQEDMEEFRRLLTQGAVRRAYKGLLSYMMDLRGHFRTCHPEYTVSGLYQGYLDMTYFALVPPPLKARDLKIAIVFNYDAFRFEAWLAGSNRQVQRQAWELFRQCRWPNYRVVDPAPGVDSIVECDLAVNFDLDEAVALTTNMESATAAFIDDMVRFLERSESARG